ncbi:hypothetical protein J1N35_010793 [Gossypium stocksii]|uniref:Uncharacterized protein n=1 Tax=Gossypium stocksii TaxID=47602 RepID=A0A9D4ACT7_9ROSI|nr:hypothetical protein J1N35_010793 [Gossypium stocksii]
MVQYIENVIAKHIHNWYVECAQRKKQVYIETHIYQYMKRCISSQKVRIFFPHLVMALCKRAGVQMVSNEQSIKLSKSTIGDTLCTQYTELCTKQIKKWNKRQ